MPLCPIYPQHLTPLVSSTHDVLSNVDTWIGLHISGTTVSFPERPSQHLSPFPSKTQTLSPTASSSCTGLTTGRSLSFFSISPQHLTLSSSRAQAKQAPASTFVGLFSLRVPLMPQFVSPQQYTSLPLIKQ